MTGRKRFIASVTQTAKTCTPALPYARGARRAAFIAKRTLPNTPKKTA